nr:hypothetical protein [Tanacetum cinerariifolium]
GACSVLGKVVEVMGEVEKEQEVGMRGCGDMAGNKE